MTTNTTTITTPTRRDRLDNMRMPSTPGLLVDRPPISALFLVDFDVKAGYTISWKQAEKGIELEGTVEYKSLPSGLHTVEEDLVYFVHEDGYAGLSAFYNLPTDEEDARHARMLAVGILVPLSYGRLGRAWKHAEQLKKLSKSLATNKKQTHLLDEYWAEHSRKEEEENKKVRPASSESLSGSPSSHSLGRPSASRGHARKRSASDGAALMGPSHRLSPLHPAWRLQKLLDTFGPLVFPIYRAAVLRKRILISSHAPVHETCDFVYNISVLANIPLSVLDVLDPAAPIQRLRPLFTVGVHDIPFLIEDHLASKRSGSTNGEQRGSSSDEAGSGWIACTTDSILAMKDDLWDVLITMPPPHSEQAREKAWPTVESPRGVAMKATQRDLRRFRSLKAGLERLADPSGAEGSAHADASSGGRPSSTSTPSGVSGVRGSDTRIGDDADLIVEPTTWAALAYTGFMWWASAGEQRRAEETDEAADDATLLADLGPAPPMMPQRQASSYNISGTVPAPRRSTTFGDALPTVAGDDEGDGNDDDDKGARLELAIIAYFHRYTTGMLKVLADIVDSADDPDDDDDDLFLSGETSETAAEEALLLPSDDEGEGEEHAAGPGGGVRVDSDALSRMGLDVWSQADAAFVRELTARYLGRRAVVEGKMVEVCGLKVC